jgi:hypothetical protein
MGRDESGLELPRCWPTMRIDFSVRPSLDLIGDPREFMIVDVEEDESEGVAA